MESIVREAPKLSNPLWLLITLLLLITLPIINLITGQLTIYLLPIVYTAVVILGMYTVSGSNRISLPGILIGLSLIAIVWINYSIGQGTALFLLQALVLFAFFAGVLILLGRNVLSKEVVDLYVLYGVTIGYILLGILCSLVVGVMDTYLPSSFSNTAGPLDSFDYLYFSFVTMSTLGYGDILPITQASKSVVILITLCGQIYMSLVVAVVVGKFLTSISKSKQGQ